MFAIVYRYQQKIELYQLYQPNQSVIIVQHFLNSYQNYKMFYNLKLTYIQANHTIQLNYEPNGIIPIFISQGSFCRAD
jgi:hypothetical protein